MAEAQRTHATPDCIPVTEYQTRIYQQLARARFEANAGQALSPWSWIRTTCDQQCLNGQHMLAHSPISIAYPPGVCIYCGMPAGTKDHLLPKPWTGEGRRHRVAVVPACGDCNFRINDLPDANVDARRAKAHDSVRKSKRKLLRQPDWTDEQLEEFGPTLRDYVRGMRSEKAKVLFRLSWPIDPAYDLRAFQKSGIEDPVALGLCAAMGRAA